MPIKRWRAVIDGKPWEEFTVEAKTEATAQRLLGLQLLWACFNAAFHRWEAQSNPVVEVTP